VKSRSVRSFDVVGPVVRVTCRRKTLWDREVMKTHLNCPCGEAITGNNEDDLVDKVQAHLSEAHPGREYDRDAILFMAY
jgi:hypothetical protein